MKNFDALNVFKPNINYTVCSLLCQYWNSQHFSYLNTPRPNNGILLVTHGKIEFVSQSGTLTASSGDMVFLPKGSRYKAIIRKEFGKTVDYLINFDSPLPEGLSLTPQKIQHTSQSQYIDIFDNLISLGMRNDHDAFCIKSQFFALLDKIVKDCARDSVPQTDLIYKAQKLLSDENDLSVSDIARECGISVSGLRNLFDKSVGVSPLQYRMNLKINRAKFLLESTDMSVYVIADELNFYDEAYFCKMFKKYVGCSPKKYVMNKRI